MNNTILIIEDNRDVRENTSEILELANYNVLTANDGKEGLEIARKNKLDLILCDIMMPELDGYGVLRAIENTPDMAGVPFVFITAKSEAKDFRRGMDLGADDYLTKPFTGNDLLRVVSARIKKNQILKEKFNKNFEDLEGLINEVKTNKEIGIFSEHRTIKKVQKKEHIYMEIDTPNFLYFIVRGKIKTFKTNELGKEFITEIYKEGDFFGYHALLDHSNHKESAVAIEDSEVSPIPKNDFFQLLFSNNEISLKFIKLISNNLIEAEENLLKLAYNSARKRVAEALLFIYSKYFPEDRENEYFPVARENISALAGISPESVSRNLTDFKEDKLIEIDNGIIKILNFKKLRNLKN